MTIKQLGGVFGRNPTFNDVTIEGELTFDGDIDVNSDLKVDGDLEVTGTIAVGNSSAGAKVDVRTDPGDYAVRLENGSGYYFRVADGGLTEVGGNVKLTTAGSGIDFSATSGTGTSELFDDYEEGTWTPTFEGSTSGSLVFGSVLQATYFKIGKLVYVNCYLASGNIAGNTVSGNCLIKGLPYTGDPYSSAVTVTQCNLFTFDEEDISISGYCEGSNVRLVRGSRGTNITDSDVGTAGTAGTIMFQMTYGAL